jgi:hypothetical protein
MKTLWVLFGLIFISQISYSQQGDWNITGNLQLRSELDGRDFSHDTYPLTFTSLRTRVGVEKAFSNLSFFAQIQDSRVFGEERGTLTNIRNLDLHQGYVTLSDLFALPLSLQAGRFEMVYGTERFFGAVGWHYIGRSWDGARIRLKPGFNLDVFALTMIDNQGYIANATPSAYTYPSETVPSTSVYGFWSSFNPAAGNQMDPFFYYEISREKDSEGDPVLSRYTAGINYFFRVQNFAITFEGAYQFGRMRQPFGSFDVSAYLLSLQLMHTANPFRIGAGSDMLSGSEPYPGTGEYTYRTFDPAYGTNHKFYGFMDYFINIPRNTNNAGLHDFYITALLNPADSKFSGQIWLHHFTTNKTVADRNVFGQELDLTLSYNFVKGTSLTWGGSLFFPGDLMKYNFRLPGNNLREDPAFWSYLMISASI